jgi:pantetheine-phosphate adenylyltransferase
MRRAMYAFSGDPITYGHIDIIERASKAFDQLIVGIGVNPDKTYMFTLEERADMAEKSLAHIPNVRVVSFKGLLVDYAYENKIPFIVKGVRNPADLEYEHIRHKIGKSQKLKIDTFLLVARSELAHISSGAVKALQKEQGLIHEWVPLYVKQCLEAKMLGQYIVGVTGEIGAGKSYICEKYRELGEKAGIPVYHIEFDHIGHKILGELKEPRYQEVREDILKTFGQQVRNPDKTINRKALGEIVFNDPEQLKKLNEMLHTPLIVRLKRELYSKKGLILLNAALIAETDMAYLCNNNVVLISVNQESQQRRLKGRSLSDEQIQRRLTSQYSYNHGKTWIVNNSDDNKLNSAVFKEICDRLGVKGPGTSSLQ